MFLKSFPKGPCRFTNVLIITIHSVTLVPVNHSTFSWDGAFVLGGNWEVFDGITPFEINLYIPFITNFFKLLLSAMV